MESEIIETEKEEYELLNCSGKTKAQMISDGREETLECTPHRRANNRCGTPRFLLLWEVMNSVSSTMVECWNCDSPLNDINCD